MLATEPRYRQESAAATLESVGAVGDTTNQWSSLLSYLWHQQLKKNKNNEM